MTLVKEYQNNITNELKQRWNNWSIVYEQKEVYEVIGGLLARQTSLVHYYVESPNMWNFDCGPIVMRSLAENYLNICWILIEDSHNRAKLFIDYGLGQEKLMLEKQKEANKGNEEVIKQIEQLQQFWEEQKLSVHTDINFGAWNNKSTRQIAKEAKEDEFYDFVYAPFSEATHGTWNHVFKYNITKSDNPLHGYLKIPDLERMSPNIHFLDLSAKYMRMAFNKVDEYIPLPDDLKIISSEDILQDKIDILTKEIKEEVDVDSSKRATTN